MKRTQKEVIEACQTAPSMAAAAAKLNIKLVTLKKYAIPLGVWNPNPSGKGTRKEKLDYKDKFNLEDILAGKHPQYISHRLKLRLYKAELKLPKCEECGIEDWQGKPISFHLEHIDGNHYNHSLENLQILCPNCHSQTETFSGKKNKMPR